MKKILCALAMIAAWSTLASISHAACIAGGEISRISVNLGSANFYVRNSNPGSVSFLFATNDPGQTAAAVTAQASHMRVTATGSFSACTAPVNGSSSGGNLVTLTTAP